MKATIYSWLLVIAVMVFAFILRIYNLDNKCLWYDEAESVSAACEYDLRTIWGSEESRSPIYYWILKLWAKLFGLSEFSLRMPAVIFGVLAIPLLYKVASMIFNRRVALLSALLLTISPLSVYYSQEVNYGSLIIFSVLLSMFLFCRMLLNKSSMCPYIIFNGIIIFIHPTCFFIVIIQNLSILLIRKNNKNLMAKWIRSQIPIFLFFIIWLFIFYRFETLKNITYWTIAPNPGTLLETLESFSHGVYQFAMGGSGFKVMQGFLLVPRLLLLIYGGFLIYGLLSLIKRGFKEKGIITVIWFFLPILILYVFSRLFFSIYAVRFLICSLPAYFLLVAYGISRIKYLYLQVFVALILVVLTLFPLRIIYEPTLVGIGKNTGWRELAEEVRKQAKPHESIVISPLRQIVPFWFYYKPDKRTKLLIDRMGAGWDEEWEKIYYDGSHSIMGPKLGQAVIFVEKFHDKLKSPPGVWLVVSPYWHNQNGSGEYLVDYFSRHFELQTVKDYPYHGVFLYHFISRE